MARHVFFSFHYQDVIDFRANVVRNHWTTKPDRRSAGFFDKSVWETAKKDSPLAVKRLVNKAITGTSRTAVLIGTETAYRPWVRYEIFRSLFAGNQIVGVHINGIKGRDQRTKAKGPSPFVALGLYYSDDGQKVTPCHLSGGSWHEFTEHPPYALKGRAPHDRWGRVFSLRGLGWHEYDWTADEGYANFASWVA